jgi:pimeloyl-ACP methyl ester carboxylesterase
MLNFAQHLLTLIYTLVPVGVVFWSIAGRRKRGAAIPIASMLITLISGVIIGALLVLLNAELLQGKVNTMETVRAIYITIAMLFALKLIDRWLLRRIFRLIRIPLHPHGAPVSPNRPRALLGLLAQRLVMLGIIIPYSAAMLMTYRPKAVLPGTPKTVLGMDYADAHFQATDGMPLAGWWVASSRMGKLVEADAADRWGRETVILCHGLGSGKERMLSLAKLLASRGYNVFLFDFRAHGESGGNFVSYGDRERYDVLGALEWIHANHAYESTKIHGIGQNTGAAALLAAAADPNHGEAIESLVLYEPYARFDTLSAETAQRLLPRGVRWLVRFIGVPLASLHAGCDLAHFSPVNYADQLWPRPVLIVHGRGQTFIPTMEEMSLYQNTPLPKEEFWPSDNYVVSRERLLRSRKLGEAKVLSDMFREWLGTRDAIWSDPGVQHRTTEFLHDAQPLNAI